MPGWAIRQSAISMTSCDRWARNPAAPSRLTANLTLVRQPSPGAARPSPAPSPSPGQRLDGDRPVDPGDAAELLADHGRLELPLQGQRRMLPVAAAASARTGVRAGRLDPARRRVQDVHRVGPGEPGRDLGDPGPDSLAGQRVPDEHDRARTGGTGDAVQAGHARATVRRLAGLQLDQIPGGEPGTPASLRGPRGPLDWI